MRMGIEVPNLESIFGPADSVAKQRAMNRATISDLHFEQGDEIKEGELFAVLFNDYGICEVAAPASGILISSPYEEGDSVASEEVLATIENDLWHDRPAVGAVVSRRGFVVGGVRLMVGPVRGSPCPSSTGSDYLGSEFKQNRRAGGEPVGGSAARRAE